jgi:hypothetical protein
MLGSEPLGGWNGGYWSDKRDNNLPMFQVTLDNPAKKFRPAAYLNVTTSMPQPEGLSRVPLAA